jgi:release factor glutamine methyltransferase
MCIRERVGSEIFIRDSVSSARQAITAAGVRAQDAALDAEVLARKVLACDRADYIVRLRDQEPADFAGAYGALVDRRCRREPVAYIVGEREFWGLPFEVTPDVLIPRPETELIVEEALALFPAPAAPRVIVDAGTGSGCLAISLAREFPSAQVIATDISESAIVVATRNAARNGVTGRISFRPGDLLEPVTEAADLIVSNPPYVASGDAPGMVPEVREHEPHVALFGGADGMAMFEKLFPSAVTRLAPGGRLIVEVGYDQDDRVAAIAARHGWTLSHVRQDLQAITRTLIFVGR